VPRWGLKFSSFLPWIAPFMVCCAFAVSVGGAANVAMLPVFVSWFYFLKNFQPFPEVPSRFSTQVVNGVGTVTSGAAPERLQLTLTAETKPFRCSGAASPPVHITA
jgi:hypothetical protein